MTIKNVFQTVTPKSTVTAPAVKVPSLKSGQIIDRRGRVVESRTFNTRVAPKVGKTRTLEDVITNALEHSWRSNAARD